MCLFKRGLLSNYFRDMATLTSHIHAIPLYKKFWPFYIPHCVTNFPKFSIRFQGPEFFNSVSREKYQFVWRKT